MQAIKTWACNISSVCSKFLFYLPSLGIELECRACGRTKGNDKVSIERISVPPYVTLSIAIDNKE